MAKYRAWEERAAAAKEQKRRADLFDDLVATLEEISGLIAARPPGKDNRHAALDCLDRAREMARTALTKASGEQ